MLFKKEKVLDLIPQKYPMVMVDGLIKHTPNSTTSRLILNESNIFCKDGFFTEPGLIENIAQTAALRSGYEARLKNEKPAVGFIGALKRIKIHKLPEDSETLETTITILNSLMNVLIIKGEVYCKGQLMAEGEINIFLKETKPRPKGRGNT